jgi:hypothetical protein
VTIDKVHIQDKDLYSEARAKPVPWSAVSSTEQVATNHSVIHPGPFIMMHGLITSMPISVTAHFEYPKNNYIGLSVLQSKVE